MSYQFYKILHIIGIVSVFMGLAAVFWNSYVGGPKKFKGRKIVMITHGLGLFLVLFAGFGLMARTGIASGSWPGWIHAKLTIWLILGGIAALGARKPNLALPLWFAIIALAGTAAYLANYKPF